MFGNSIEWLCSIIVFASLAIAQANPSSQPVLNTSFMDRTIDPCVDFFQYSCAGWIKNNSIPPDQSNWSIYSQVSEANKAQLRGILDAAAANPKSSTTNQKIGDYYSSCMDLKTIEDAGAKPLQPQLDNIDHLGSKAQIAEAAALMTGDDVLFGFGSNQDFKDATQVIAQADQGGIGLPDRDYYLKDDAKSVELRKAYLAHVQKMFELLGDKPETAATDAQTVMRIETALAKGSLTRVERRDPKKLYHKLSTDELQRISASFGWDAYFAKVGLPSLKSLNVTSPEFFKTVNEVLKKEDVGSWKTYLRWKLVHANASYLSSAFVNEDFNFYGKTLEGKQELPPRWKRCTEDVDNDIGEALGKAYVEKYFSPQAKQDAMTMVRQIEAAMQNDIESLPWMSAATKERALEKLRAVANKIGYPDKWRDYSKLEIRAGDEFGNVLRARQFEFDRQLAKIGKPVDKGEWLMTPPTVNAYYDSQMNDINFPAGILQPPLFSETSDAAPNYGNTGSTIGHELTHGFDDEGRQFNAQGNLQDWWTEKDGKEFEKRAACISDQYSQYVVVDDVKINGKLTLGEDVADLGGLFLAYMAWKKDTEGQRLDPIDGLTPQQRFFVGYGQSWCDSTRDETARMRATIDPHSPAKYRANGVVSNLPQFQEAFQCKSGAPMVRADRCRVW
jgi:endothelin-converting enzyme/putative endopeptidase